MANNSNAQEITLTKMIVQWRHLPHKFTLNVWNFEVLAARAATEIFKRSFELGRFNSSGSPMWAPRKRDKSNRPILIETGTLRESFSWKHLGQKGMTNGGAIIYTNPNKFKTTKSHKGFCFAAVHNAPDKEHTRTGHMANMPQRQFMGHSTVLREKLKELSSVIFEGFPK